MAVTKKIDTYQVMYSSNRFVPRIWLQGDGTGIGQLVFMENGSTLPPDYETPTGSYSLHYHLDDYPHLLDLLRNEAPVYLFYQGPSGENAIKTTTEMVGEEEGG
jgi:hypothetical protein